MGPSNDMEQFRALLKQAKHVVVLTGAGISAESGIPTFRGAGGLWRQYQATDLASPYAFQKNPSLVWEFYHHRREVVFSKRPNAAHLALAQFEKDLASRAEKDGRQPTQFVVITQNIDELHLRAGTSPSCLLELHGSLFKTRCTECGLVGRNEQSPICEALRGRGAPTATSAEPIPLEQLPRCTECAGLLRPHVVWFGEQLEPDVLETAMRHVDQCDLLMIVGTSSVVYPAAMMAPSAAQRGVPVAEFNIETTPATDCFGFHFAGPATTNVPQAVLDL